MSDDLVKRLRSPINIFYEYAADDGAFLQEAADRIEELEAKLATCEKYRDAYAEFDRIGTQAVRDLEAKLKTSDEIGRALEEDAGQLRAKLAKAVVALKFHNAAVELCIGEVTSAMKEAHKHTKRTLAEIGGKDE